ncbi:MAG: hypothetical protein LOD92_03075, partial [Bacillales bacterium]
QSGVPEFKLGDPVHDYRILETAQRDAAILIDAPVFWQGEQYAALRKVLESSDVLKGEKLD